MNIKRIAIIFLMMLGINKITNDFFPQLSMSQDSKLPAYIGFIVGAMVIAYFLPQRKKTEEA